MLHGGLTPGNILDGGAERQLTQRECDAVTGMAAVSGSSSLRDVLPLGGTRDDHYPVACWELTAGPPAWEPRRDSPPGSGGRPLPHVPGVTHRFVNVRGVRLHVAEAGGGDPVVLLHSFPQHWYAWGTSSRCYLGSTG